MVMPGRNYESSGQGYRYSINGQEREENFTNKNATQKDFNGHFEIIFSRLHRCTCDGKTHIPLDKKYFACFIYNLIFSDLFNEPLKLKATTHEKVATTR